MEFPKFTSIPPAQVMYKNQLQEYTQKNVKQLPIYQTVNEGFPHAPKFRAKVLVDGSEYESKSTYPTKKEAEQAVAKIAYECIHNKIDARDISLIYKSRGIWIGLYITLDIQKGQAQFIFVTWCWEAKSYKGELAGSKQMAKQVVAQAAIESLLETDAGTLYQIIMSKNKSHPSMQTRMDTGSS
ncbi:hypothetical protein AABB24_006647 [Solanum stoloniferum]|uniref:DRBM domain-containing protein n=1 Tax=Solanum stoloniferum TaxID=62892 RepID=A0ABD2V6B3_9SOLN